MKHLLLVDLTAHVTVVIAFVNIQVDVLNALKEQRDSVLHMAVVDVVLFQVVTKEPEINFSVQHMEVVNVVVKKVVTSQLLEDQSFVLFMVVGEDVLLKDVSNPPSHQLNFVLDMEVEKNAQRRVATRLLVAEHHFVQAMVVECVVN